MDKVRKTPGDTSWFVRDRFGMFIHWGLYAITGRDMWYYSQEMVPKEEYERLAARFNPLARNASTQGAIKSFPYGVFVTLKSVCSVSHKQNPS